MIDCFHHFWYKSCNSTDWNVNNLIKSHKAREIFSAETSLTNQVNDGDIRSSANQIFPVRRLSLWLVLIKFSGCNLMEICVNSVFV